MIWILRETFFSTHKSGLTLRVFRDNIHYGSKSDQNILSVRPTALKYVYFLCVSDNCKYFLKNLLRGLEKSSWSQTPAPLFELSPKFDRYET